MSCTYKDYFDKIRKPMAPPTRVHRTAKDYSRVRNYTYINNYVDAIKDEGGDEIAEETS